MAVLTLYYRNISHTINGLNAKQLTQTQGSTHESVRGDGNWRCIVYIRRGNGDMVRLHDSDTVTTSFTPKAVSVQPTDAIVVEEQLGGSSLAFITAQLNHSGYVKPVPWTIHRYTTEEEHSDYDSEFGWAYWTEYYFYYGSPGFNSRIEGIELGVSEKKYITNIGGYEAPEEYGTISVAHTHGDWVWGAWEEVEYAFNLPQEGIVAAVYGGFSYGSMAYGGAATFMVVIEFAVPIIKSPTRAVVLSSRVSAAVESSGVRASVAGSKTGATVEKSNTKAVSE